MSQALRTGSNWALVEERRLYDQLRGAQNIAIYEGDPLGIDAVIAGLYNYERFERQQDGPVHRLTVYSPDLAEAPVFELLTNHKEKHILEHPKAKSISEPNIAVIVKAVKNATELGLSNFTGTTEEKQLAWDVWFLMMSKTDKFFTEDYVLRYQVTVSNAIALNLAYANTDRLFTNTQLLTPATSGIVIPAGIATSIGNIPAKTETAEFVWTWLKRAPTARQTQIGKVVIQQEWWLSLWSNLIYDPVA